ncbi:MAG: 30S ribosomal protein S20 [Candidatus Omnitrophica bacterium]|nr:MAG: 30S ribosomal protein S20 [Candidatus Hinthialibacteria bacterium OLB16]MBK7496757.1 30S ribosomal protein S20 [Candidatus Omnitrophota bacterium]MBV6482366.1 30S ribosomal protein S20 [bacterium]MCE7908481.1 30S ribosomal protein S20 [Candidatus Omnitrophica bacterium COP1]MCL4736097.1 30S ribosomal protein S20 [Candidatus Omnitrophota bacterium]
MAHHKSAIKRLKTNEKSRVKNRAVKSRCRTLEKKFRAVLAAPAKEGSPEMLRGLQKTLDQAVSRGVMKPQTASRKISRLMKAHNQAQS